MVRKSQGALYERLEVAAKNAKQDQRLNKLLDLKALWVCSVSSVHRGFGEALRSDMLTSPIDGYALLLVTRPSITNDPGVIEGSVRLEGSLSACEGSVIVCR